MPLIISIVGKSNSGKTTFLEKLIPELKKKGYKIGIVKHSHHDIDIDKEGKDSWRHQKAGADNVMAVSPGKIAMVKKTATEISLDELQIFFSDMDLVITEGYKKENKPKIEIFREEIHKTTLCGVEDNLAALVTDSDIAANVPVFGTKNFKEVADFIETTFIKKV